MTISGTETGRFRNRPVHPQGETITECVEDMKALLAKLADHQHQSDDISYPIALDVMDRFSDLIHLFGWTAVADDIDTAHQRHKRAYYSVRSRALESAIKEQAAWMVSCGGTLPGYIQKYGDPGMGHCYGNGGSAIYWADLNYLNRLRAEAGMPLVEGVVQ